jgi:alkylation response protein AidB-like acyl-CoA dehydrogenase
MGWAGVVIPEAYDGAAFGYLSMGLVLEQLGATLTASPLVVSSVAAATGIARAGSADLKSRWLPQIARGEAIATIAVDEPSRRSLAQATLSAHAVKGGFVLKGEKRPVLHGMAANLAIVAARTGAGVTLFVVPTDTAGLERHVLHEIEKRGAARYVFNDVHVSDADVLGRVDDGAAILDQILDAAAIGAAAEMLGAAQAAFDTTVAYLKTRTQFGKLIGEFQALQHRAAAMLGELEMTRSAVEAALAAMDEGGSDTSELVSLAKAFAGDTFRRVACEMVQMHGGIGMTEEHDAGLFLKRARTMDMAFGTAGYHRERYAALVGV